MEKQNLSAASVLAVGLVLGCFLLAGALTDRHSERVVTVKGLVEKTVRADYVSWPLYFTASASELADAYAKVKASQKLIQDFLLANGLSREDISINQWRVVDQNANEYGNGAGKDRYIIYAGILVSTNKIDQVLDLTMRTAELVEQGIVLSNSTASFRFNGLNAIKPELIAQATKNARASAEQFASDSGSRVGEIARANQGVISILSKGSDMDDPAAPDKTVRVVTTIDYFLKD